MKLKIIPGFNAYNAYRLSLASQIAYLSPDKIEIELLKLEIQRFNFISVGDAQCYVAETDDHYLIVFRGTESDIGDWLTDLNFDFKRHFFGLVHDGFGTSFSQLYPEILSHIRQYKEKPVFIAGHSLGAALAGLCAIQLKMADFDIVGVYTYGMPRIGNHMFASNYDMHLKSVTHRIVNNNDIVTRVPPRVMGYQHVGSLQYITSTGKISAKMSCWRKFLDRINGRFDDLFSFGADGLKDHFIAKYIKQLENKS